MDIASALKRTMSATTAYTLDENLSRHGYCVVEDALPMDMLRGLSEEIQMLEEVLKISPNRLATSESEHAVLVKPNVRELSIVERSSLAVENTALLNLAKHLNSLWVNRVAITDAFKSSCTALNSLTALDQVKVAIIHKGGCFPCHTDTHIGTGRLLSVTLYLEESFQRPNRLVESPEEHDGGGGQLRVYTYPVGAPVDVEPYFGRMVLFSACNTFHRVLPSSKEAPRLCLSLMFYGHDNFDHSPLVHGNEADGVRYSTSFPLQLDSVPLELLRLRALLTPLLYFEEFRSSMREAFTLPAATSHGDSDSAVESTQMQQLAEAIDYFTTKCKRAAQTDVLTMKALALYADICRDRGASTETSLLMLASL